MSPLQAAFVDKDALQCGFCTPGFVVAGTACSRRTRAHASTQIKAGLAGNLCRCGTYGRIFEAVEGREVTPRRRAEESSHAAAAEGRADRDPQGQAEHGRHGAEPLEVPPPKTDLPPWDLDSVPRRAWASDSRASTRR